MRLASFFFTDTATTEIYTLSLHDALPISWCGRGRSAQLGGTPTVPKPRPGQDRKSTRLNSSHTVISYAVFCLKKKKLLPTHRAVYDGHLSVMRRALWRCEVGAIVLSVDPA